MGMTIDEVIAKEQELFRIFQKTVDTHMVSGDLSLEELYCDDTEIIEAQLKMYQRQVDFHNQIIDIIHKYQKIEKIIDDWENSGEEDDPINIIDNIEEVIEDGKTD